MTMICKFWFSPGLQIECLFKLKICKSSFLGLFFFFYFCTLEAVFGSVLRAPWWRENAFQGNKTGVKILFKTAQVAKPLAKIWFRWGRLRWSIILIVGDRLYWDCDCSTSLQTSILWVKTVIFYDWPKCIFFDEKARPF